MSDLYDDAIEQETAREQQEEEQEKRANQYKEDLRFLMRHQGGRRIFAQLLRYARMWETSFAPDKSVTEFNEGARHVGLMIYTDLKRYCPNQLLIMLKETHDDERRNQI